MVRENRKTEYDGNGGGKEYSECVEFLLQPEDAGRTGSLPSGREKRRKWGGKTGRLDGKDTVGGRKQRM